MTTLREAAQQALEALEALQGGCTDSDDGTVEAITVWCPEIIDALKDALAEPEQKFDHSIGADRFKVVRGTFWWHIKIGDSPTEHGKFRSSAAAQKMADDLLREFRNGAFFQNALAALRVALIEPVGETTLDVSGATCFSATPAKWPEPLKAEMPQDDIIRLAREAGFDPDTPIKGTGEILAWEGHDCVEVSESLKRFAALVTAEKDKEIERLREEVRVLRLYGNKDCTSMADEALKQETPR